MFAKTVARCFSLGLLGQRREPSHDGHVAYDDEMGENGEPVESAAAENEITTLAIDSVVRARLLQALCPQMVSSFLLNYSVVFIG